MRHQAAGVTGPPVGVKGAADDGGVVAARLSGAIASGAGAADVVMAHAAS
jgi:hypothetical protein